ncbi:MAG: S46 family peptidase [Candidatus Azobacteroides sp.]|nr:S46 family peptidase [Candidatus Azobacteroides sp.]
MILKRFLTLLPGLLLYFSLFADEGMWMLNNLTQENWKRMQELGLELSSEDLYCDSLPSLYKTVVQFNGGCTGITVSKKGLIFTNHHCGYDAIQSQSSIEQDYLKNGFIAHAFEEEIPIPNMYVLYPRGTINITQKVMHNLSPNLSEKEREIAIEQAIGRLQKQFNDSLPHYEVVINSYYGGNEYYANIYQRFSDIRLAFAPPSSVGKFGGETDNWMWPRHTGDFCVFRVYADEENKPANYQETNIPYQPDRFAPISLNGYENNSFVMAMGFPGHTDRYLSSWGIERKIESSNNPRIKVGSIKLDIWKDAMLNNDEIRIQYASKYALNSNYWKNSIGMNRGIEKLHVIERKQELENQFLHWMEQNPEKQAIYSNTLNLLRNGYIGSMEKVKAKTFLSEIFHGAEILEIAHYVHAAGFLRDHSERDTFFDEALAPILKDYNASLDEKVLTAMLGILKNNLPPPFLPSVFSEIDKKYKGNYVQYADDVFKETVLAHPDKLHAALLNPKKFMQIKKDRAYQLSRSVRRTLESIHDSLQADSYKIREGERLFIAGLREMEAGKNLPPDANFTLRLTYGSVGGYVPNDGAWYEYYTTTKGIFEKQDSINPEFNVQPEVMALLHQKNFGKYGNQKGDMNLNFLSNLDITGGNSGSPVFDAKGRLIGLAFDGNWEAISGDLLFENEVQKCIAVDIRYVLFMIDKWGNSQRLLDELQIQ